MDKKTKTVEEVEPVKNGRGKDGGRKEREDWRDEGMKAGECDKINRRKRRKN